MDLDQYGDIAERGLEIGNPVTDRKLKLLDDYCDIRDGLKVLDIGCGKAWVMRQWAARFAIDGVGLDRNRRFLDFAYERPPGRGAIRYVLGAADAFEAAPDSFDIVMCLGASEALGGFVGAVDWMVEKAPPGGSIVVGEMTLKHRPFAAQDHILPHDAVDTIAIIERHGAEVSAVISASDADYERYASHRRHATLVWAREHPGASNCADVLAKSRLEWNEYLRWVRPYYGWDIFVARKAD
jgi:cyclopropane fatty-acyl-phospholipid synthase-like methyltransferase